MPKHRVYIEPFGGAMSVLMRKLPAYAEVYNDLDGDVVNLFRVLRSDKASKLVEHIKLTPFARDEFIGAYEPTDDVVERARRLVIRSFMGFGSNGHNKATGFRASSNRSGTTPSHDWTNLPANLRMIIDRISGVTIENKDAIMVMSQHDCIDALHYVDPPYVFATRSDSSHDYAHEMTDGDHARLLDFLPTLRGFVMLSGYPSETYDVALKGWERIEKKALADGAKKRTEVLWMNPACSRSLGRERLI
jgi:DNA adenine methylase